MDKKIIITSIETCSAKLWEKKKKEKRKHLWEGAHRGWSRKSKNWQIGTPACNRFILATEIHARRLLDWASSEHLFGEETELNIQGVLLLELWASHKTKASRWYPYPHLNPVTFFVSKRVGRGEYWAKRLFPLSSATILSGGGEEDGRWKRECSRGWGDKKKKNGSGVAHWSPLFWGARMWLSPILEACSCLNRMPCGRLLSHARVYRCARWCCTTRRPSLPE